MATPTVPGSRLVLLQQGEYLGQQRVAPTALRVTLIRTRINPQIPDETGLHPMSTVSLRDRRQVTLPQEIVTAAGLETNDTLEISVVNGVIQLVPVNKARANGKTMARFLGAAGSLYGSTATEVDTCVREQRNSW